MPVIGFDIGGTKTDVSRYHGSLELVFETTTAGVSIQAPQLDINTVAAGGGSRLFLRSGIFYVGPESAGAHLGPVCYRKNGYLAVTDANLVLGRLLPQYFPSIFGPKEDQPLDLEGAREAFAALLATEEGNKYSEEELAYGFLKVANEAMCRPIRNLSQMKGFDIRTHKLACFGGAGPQHACAIAKALGMSKVFVHRYGGVLSAYGLSMDDAVKSMKNRNLLQMCTHTVIQPRRRRIPLPLKSRPPLQLRHVGCRNRIRIHGLLSSLIEYILIRLPPYRLVVLSFSLHPPRGGSLYCLLSGLCPPRGGSANSFSVDSWHPLQCSRLGFYIEFQLSACAPITIVNE